MANQRYKNPLFKQKKTYLNYRNTNNPNLKKHYKRYCQILSEVITAAKSLHYSKRISQSDNKKNYMEYN
jgi:hypothetical protein